MWGVYWQCRSTTNELLISPLRMQRWTNKNAIMNTNNTDLLYQYLLRWLSKSPYNFNSPCHQQGSELSEIVSQKCKYLRCASLFLWQMLLRWIEEFQVQGVGHRQKLNFEGLASRGTPGYPHPGESISPSGIFSSSLGKLAWEARGDKPGGDKETCIERDQLPTSVEKSLRSIKELGFCSQWLTSQGGDLDRIWLPRLCQSH